MFSKLDLKSLWKELDEYDNEVEEESKTLQEVWIKIAELKEVNQNDANLYVSENSIESLRDYLDSPHSVSPAFAICLNRLAKEGELQFLDPDTLISLNIGGQLFETSVEILTRDPFSILAAYCRAKPLFQCGPDGKTFFIDRDWWIFRHILSYLRSSILPNELETLKELYKEASFYRLEALQRSIEEIPLSRISNLSHHINP